MDITINNNRCKSLQDIKECASSVVYDFITEYLNDAPYVTAHTSGSTGKPKEIKLLKSDMRASARLTNEFFGLNHNSLFYLNLSPQYIAGKMMIVRALELSASIIEEKPSNEPLSAYEDNRHIDLAAFVPSQIDYLLKTPEKLALINNMIIGGGKVPTRVRHWLADKGVGAYCTYGMTETCSHIALSSVNDEDNTYTALGEVTFATDNRDCLIINTPHLSTKKYVTNDIAELISPTRFKWCGRYDNVINTGGIKVYPEEIEQKISGLIHDVRFFVTSRPSEKWGEEIVLAVEYSSLPEGEKKEGETQPALIEKMKKILPSYAVPRHYIAVRKFKETPTGKIIRRI